VNAETADALFERALQSAIAEIRPDIGALVDQAAEESEMLAKLEVAGRTRRNEAEAAAAADLAHFDALLSERQQLVVRALDASPSALTDIQAAIEAGNADIASLETLLLEIDARLDEVRRNLDRQVRDKAFRFAMARARQTLALAADPQAAHQESGHPPDAEAPRRRLRGLVHRKPASQADAKEALDAGEADPTEQLAKLKTARDNVIKSIDSTKLEVARLEAQHDREVRRILASRPETAEIEARISSFEKGTVKALCEKGVLPICRLWIDEQLRQRNVDLYGLRLRVKHVSGLGEFASPGRELATDAYGSLAALLNQLPGGSIGISGSRGAGKTTLIRAFCSERHLIRGEPPALAAVVSAPVNYEPREFVLHLFAKLCRSVLGDAASTTVAPRLDTPELLDSLKATGIAAGIGVLLIAVGLGLVIMTTVSGTIHSVIGYPRGPLRRRRRS
jgi:hypothetical protein